MTEPPITFAGLLQELRTGARLTQEELSEASEVSVRTISDLERGIAVKPQWGTIRRLADALNLAGPVRARFEAAARGRAFPAGSDAAADAGAAVAATRTLPRAPASFTGRQQELREVLDTAAAGELGVCTVGGMPGVGKTAFALHAAYLLAAQYPDGQIFLPLYGHTPGQRRTDPAEALASLLLTVGIPVSRIPPSLEARMALWRDWLAERRLLLVLDDAISSEQVTPLLPGTDGSFVLVTSRNRLSTLGDVAAIDLDVLLPDEAGALFVQLAGRPGLTPVDPQVRQLTDLCGCLPLALGLVARQLNRHPTWSLIGWAAELAEARYRLELMKAENVSVAAAFNLSYQELSDEQQRLFRQLGLHPGTDFDAYAAAALSGSDRETARDLLEALYDQYLLTESAHGRYQFHDLIRQHARALANRLDPGSDRDRATARLLDYYQHTAALAEAKLTRLPSASAPWSASPPPTAVIDLPDGTRALAWARTERANLLACIHYATRLGHDAHVVILTAAIAGLLRQDGPWTAAADLHAAAVEAAHRSGDQAVLAGALINLGIIKWLTDDSAEAAQALQQALSIYRELGDRLGQANALTNLGNVRQMTDCYPAAAQDQLEALSIYRSLGDRLGEANALTSLGIVRRERGDYLEASNALEQGLGIYTDLDDRIGQGNALTNLGIVLWQSNDYPGAAAALQEALDIARPLGDRLGQANALTNLGAVRRQTGDYDGAAGALIEAHGIFRDIGSRLGQANTLVYLGSVRRQTGDYPGAALVLTEALDTYRDVGDRLGQGTTLVYLGAVRRQTGDYSAAASALAEALDILSSIGDRGGEVEALNESGMLDLDSGAFDQAQASHQKALELAREIGSPWDEAHALAGLAHCALAVGQTADAIDGLRQAHEIFQRMGAAEASEVAAELATLVEPLAQ